MAVVYLAIALLGLAIGSFLNVVIYRVPRDISLVRPASSCPDCNSPVKPRHNVPVLGWLILRGRCHDCRLPISARYPLIEAATALLFVAVTAHFGVTPELPAYLYLAAVAIALAAIDFDVRRLPDSIVLPSYVVGVLLLVPAVVLDSNWSAAVRGLLAMAALFAVYFALWLSYPGGMGFGDVKLAGLIGLYLGFLGWGSVFVGTFVAFLLGAIVGIALLLARRASRKSSVPFGPFMLAGAFLALFFAAQATSWYAHLFSVTTQST
jgi:leader peptidase (prepilin peptidase)/N-methyltransferase